MLWRAPAASKGRSADIEEWICCTGEVEGLQEAAGANRTAMEGHSILRAHRKWTSHSFEAKNGA